MLWIVVDLMYVGRPYCNAALLLLSCVEYCLLHACILLNNEIKSRSRALFLSFNNDDNDYHDIEIRYI